MSIANTRDASTRQERGVQAERLVLVRLLPKAGGARSRSTLKIQGCDMIFLGR